MKMQKIVVGFIGIIASVIIGVSTASAADVFCSSATINEVSVIPAIASATTSKYAMRATCDNTGGVWTGIGLNQYFFISDIGVDGYAMALTAMSTGKKIRFYAKGTTYNSLLTRIDIIK
jgi:hypothetical protein